MLAELPIQTEWEGVGIMQSAVWGPETGLFFLGCRLEGWAQPLRSRLLPWLVCKSLAPGEKMTAARFAVVS